SRPTVRTDQLKGFLSRYLKSERNRISRIAAAAAAIIPAVMKEAIDWINDIAVWLTATSAALTLFLAHQKLPCRRARWWRLLRSRFRNRGSCPSKAGRARRRTLLAN